MIFKDWSYRKKNRALLVLAAVFLLLSWYLAFGKTFALIGNYNRLHAALEGERNTASSSRLLREKLSLQDSLLQPYRADSATWTSGLLSEVGTSLSGQSVGVSFENKAVGTSKHTVEREVVLSGSFAQLQGGLSALEKQFFVKSVRAFVDKEQLKYAVRLVAIKDTDR